jgi:curved DNA-binding protein CbpA
MAKTTDIKRIDFDPYEVLGLQPQCEENEIDRAFKKSALKWHPDKNLTNKDKAEEMFIKIYRAYEFLKDKEARAQYDQQRTAKLKRAQYEEQRRATDSTRRRKLIEDLEAREAAATDLKRSKMPEYHQAPSRAPRDDKLEELRKQGMLVNFSVRFDFEGGTQGCQMSLLKRFVLILRCQILFFVTNFIRKSYFLPIFLKNVHIFTLPDLASLEIL